MVLVTGVITTAGCGARSRPRGRGGRDHDHHHLQHHDHHHLQHHDHHFSPACVEGATKPCGSDVGACMYGTETCHDGVFGACLGDVGPKPEACTGIDENCNGTVDDCDPGSGSCTPTLNVTGSTPSSPNCIDFPVMAGGHGTITYTCPGTGGTVTATLGGIPFTGTVTSNMVTLDGYATIYPPQTPDGCTWQDHHHIEGTIQSLSLTYSYSEMVIAHPPGANCWQPCTETGTVQIIFPLSDRLSRPPVEAPASSRRSWSGS